MSEWTIVTLKEYLESLILQHDQRYSQHFTAAELAVKNALAAHEKSVIAAFLASERAIVKAEDAQKEYNIRSNEFRGQLDDQAKLLMNRLEALGLFKSTDDKISAMQRNFEDKLEAVKMSISKGNEVSAKEIADLREYRSATTGNKAGIKDFLGYIIAGIAIIGFILDKLLS